MIRGVKNLSLKNNQLELLEKFIDISKTYGFNFFLPALLNEEDRFKEFSDKDQIYNFLDKSERKIVLSPEHTAVLFDELNKKRKIFYISPCFRYERPQKSRYRQFHQLGMESLFSLKEIILLLSNLLKDFQYELIINCIGSVEEREKFIEEKKNKCSKCSNFKMFECYECDYFEKDFYSFLSENSKKEFNELTFFLEKNNIKYEWNKKLFRGIKYYKNLVFELKSKGIVFGGGGKYSFFDKKKNEIEASGMALGLERLIENVDIIDNVKKLDVSIVLRETEISKHKLNVSEEIRKKLSFANIEIYLDYEFFKKQKKNYDYCIFLEEDKITLKKIAQNTTKYTVFEYKELEQAIDMISELK